MNRCYSVGTSGDIWSSYSRYTLLTSLHRHIALMAIGSSDAEGLAAARLTSSPMAIGLWMDRRFNRCCTLSSIDLPLIYRGAQTCTDDRASDLPTTIGCTDAHASVKPVPLFSAELVQCIAAINWILQIYSGHSGFPLCFDISSAKWTCHLDGGLDLASRR